LGFYEGEKKMVAGPHNYSVIIIGVFAYCYSIVCGGAVYLLNLLTRVFKNEEYDR